MTPPSPSRRRRSIARSALALALCCALHPALAASASGSGTDTDDANYDPFSELEGEDNPDKPNRPPAYEDRIIATDKLQALPADEDDEDDSTGLPRAFHVELIAHTTRFTGARSDELGLGFGGFRDTDTLGTLSADLLIFRGRSDRDAGGRWRGTATLWQRGLQMQGGWSANSGLGVLNTPMPDLLRDQYRFFLPSVPLLGATTAWRQAGHRASWSAAIGRGGGYGGTRLSGFEIGDGDVASFGAQWAW